MCDEGAVGVTEGAGVVRVLSSVIICSLWLVLQGE